MFTSRAETLFAKTDNLANAFGALSNTAGRLGDPDLSAVNSRLYADLQGFATALREVDDHVYDLVGYQTAARFRTHADTVDGIAQLVDMDSLTSLNPASRKALELIRRDAWDVADLQSDRAIHALRQMVASGEVPRGTPAVRRTIEDAVQRGVLGGMGHYLKDDAARELIEVLKVAGNSSR